MSKTQAIIPLERIASRIYLLRQQEVMVDSDLAELYGVPTSALNQQVRRNIERFPDDFAFQLTTDEFRALTSHSVTSNNGRGGRRKPPLFFTEQGVATLSSVLRSERAAQVNVAVMRAFVKLRQLLLSDRELARKIQDHDHKIAALFDAVQKLLAMPEAPKKHTIGFAAPEI